MRQIFATASCLVAAACGPESSCHDYSTPEQAARSFLEAGRVGDTDSVRRSVVATERATIGPVDYQNLGDYTLTLDSLTVDKDAVVLLQTGRTCSPIACRKEHGDWRVTIHGTLQCMQRTAAKQPAPAPR